MEQEKKTLQPQPQYSELINEFSESISPGELKDILDAIRTLKQGSGWGRLEIVYLNSEMSDVDIIIKRKPKKKTT